MGNQLSHFMEVSGIERAKDLLGGGDGKIKFWISSLS